MVFLPKVNYPSTPQTELVCRFCTNHFWEERWDELFAPDLVVDFPHAPPGMLQHLDRFEFDAFRFWLRNRRKLPLPPVFSVLKAQPSFNYFDSPSPRLPKLAVSARLGLPLNS